MFDDPRLEQLTEEQRKTVAYIKTKEINDGDLKIAIDSFIKLCLRDNNNEVQTNFSKINRDK